MNENTEYLNKLFEMDNIKTILDVGSDKTSLNYLIEKYPNADIDAIVYPNDTRNIDSIKENVKGKYKLCEKDICNNDINKNYDLVLSHLLLGESNMFNHTFIDFLTSLLNINSKYFLIYDYKENPTVDYVYLFDYIKDHDFEYIDSNTYEKREPQEFENFIVKNYCAYFIRRLTIVDIIYRFINGYIKINELPIKLNNLKLNLYTKEQQNNIKSLIKEINNSTDSEYITKIIIKNKTYLEVAKEMNDKDLLLMITSYIKSPRVPVIDQSTFNELVDIGIKYDAREKLWRLGFNYGGIIKDFNNIVDYFIKIKDSWYLSELISIIEKYLDIDRLITILSNEKDKEFVKRFIKFCVKYEYLNENKINKLKESVNEIE